MPNVFLELSRPMKCQTYASRQFYIFPRFPSVASFPALAICFMFYCVFQCFATRFSALSVGKLNLSHPCDKSHVVYFLDFCRLRIYNEFRLAGCELCLFQTQTEGPKRYSLCYFKMLHVFFPFLLKAEYLSSCSREYLASD